METFFECLEAITELKICNGTLTYNTTVDVGNIDATAFTWHRKVEGTTTLYACLKLGILIIEYSEDTRRRYFSCTNLEDEELESWERLPSPPEMGEYWCSSSLWYGLPRDRKKIYHPSSDGNFAWGF